MRRLIWFILAIAVVVDLVVVGVPMWVIQPFRAQPPRQLALAIALRNAGPWITLLALGCILACCAWLVVNRPRIAAMGKKTAWRRVAWPAVAGFAALVALASAYMARADYFQWMFHPDPHPRFLSVAGARVAESDMVLDVAIRGHARAYPVREMAYYHVVNDRLAGVPIAATY